MRTSIDLVQHGAPSAYRWPLPYPVLIAGARPNEMDWYRIERPEWYVGEGWSLTPEAAGVAEADGRDLSRGPITGWISGAVTSGGTLMLGGRSFDPALRPRLGVTLNGRPLLDVLLLPGAFLTFVPLPYAQRDAATPEYDTLLVTTTAGARAAIEQFDASSTRPLLGFGDGWQEQEFNPRTGLRWRWLSERGELKLRPRPTTMPAGAMPPGASRQLMLRLEGESPRRYFSRGSRLVVRSGSTTVFDRVLTDDFAIDVPLADPGETLVLETDQIYVPAQRSRRTQDRRHLGLRIFKCELRAVSATP
jgi:hypothetical protein